MAKAVEQPLTRQTSGAVRDDVHGLLTERILRAEMPPDARVNIDAVAADFGVSTTPVREALARLESDGLVYKVQFRGYRTTGLLTRQEVQDLWDFRLRLEPWSAALAADRITPDQATELLAHAASLPTAPAASDFAAVKTFSDHDAHLHRTILQIAGNAVVSRTVEQMHSHLHAFRLTYDVQAGVETIHEHRSLVYAIAHGDPLEASHRMSAHLEASRNRLLPFARDEEPGSAASLR